MGDVITCHLCLMPIPRAARSHKNDRQGNARDPLYLTRDHVKPRSKGGTRTKPAHRYCNEAKGDKERISIYFIRDLQKNVMQYLAEASQNRVSNKEISMARAAMEGITLEIKAIKYKWNPVNRDLARWADDGGLVLPY